ncbi:DNA repair exonuclease, partial [bacterium]
MKILHTSDLHLRKEGDERWEALEKILGVGRKEKIDVLVISGDLFDSPVSAEELRPRIRTLFSRNEFLTVILPGNHDETCYPRGMSFGDREKVRIIRDINEKIELGNVTIYGIPYSTISEERLMQRLQDLGRKLTPEKTNILLIHGTLLDMVSYAGEWGEEEEMEYMPFHTSYFKNLNFDYILAGHFHTTCHITPLENGKYFVYSGSPVSITQKETGTRYAILIETGKEPHRVPLNTFHYLEVKITLDPFDQRNPIEIVAEKLKEVSPNVSVLLYVSGSINSSKHGITEEEFQNALNSLCMGKKVKVCEMTVRDVGKYMENEIFRLFSKKFEKTNPDDEKRKRIYQMFIMAMINLGDK